MYPMTTTMVPARTNHALHLILSFITFGFWVPVWIIVAAVNSGRMVPQLQTYVQSAPYHYPIQYQQGQYPPAGYPEIGSRQQAPSPYLQLPPVA